MDVQSFNIDIDTGQLKAFQTLTQTSTTYSSNTGGIVAASSAKVLYATDSNDDGIDAYSVAADGTLTLVSGSPFMLNSNPSSAPADMTGLVLNPSGTALYVVNGIDDSILGFDISSTTGALTPMPNSFPTGFLTWPQNAVIDPRGAFMYVTSWDTSLSGSQSAVLGFAVDSTTGNLTAMATPQFGLPTDSPNGIVLDPTGKFLYVTFETGNGIAGFVRDTTTGQLTPMAGSPFASGSSSNLQTSSIAMHPSGKFLYAFNFNGSTITAFSIDSNTGVLSSVAGSPFAIQDGVGPIALDPSGAFLYALRGCDVTTCGYEMAVYQVDQSTGELKVAGYAAMPEEFVGLAAVKTQ
ncbi:MAG: beta-propeller fold lactonase family protein [Terracidiphilus sp.]